MNYYSVYGMVVGAEIILPELQSHPQVETPDLLITRGLIQEPTPEQDPDGRYRRITETTVQGYWPDIGHFIAIAGKQIIVDAAPAALEQSLRLFTLGPMLGTILHQRGFLTLHASSVQIDGRAVGFLGGSGWGKSTMAGALLGRGHQLVADDVTPVRFTADGPVVYPGFPQLKLWPDAADMLGEDSSLLPRLHPSEEKRAHRIGEGIAANPLPLGALYVLASGDEQRIDRLTFQEAFIELVRHSYSLRLLEGTGTSKEHFQQCSKLFNAVPISRLTRPRYLPGLTQVVDLVEADVHAALVPNRA